MPHSYQQIWQSNHDLNENYRKNPKISDTRKFILITLKVEQDGVSLD